MKLNDLYNKDSIVVMSNLKRGSIDAIITDLPYNISRNNNFATMGKVRIDFGKWDKDFDLTSWIKTAELLLKKGGNIIIFNDWKNMTNTTNSLEENGFEVKDLIMWKKTKTMPRNRDKRFITDYEVAVWAVKKGGKWTFNRLNDKYEIPETVGSLAPKSEKLNGRYPAQKPIYVMKWIIERLTNEDDVVLGPFIDSGSTSVACKELNRRFIGIEFNNEYYDIAYNRINGHIYEQKFKKATKMQN